MGSDENQDKGRRQHPAVELRRGVVTLAVLSSLRTPAYGYALQQALGDAGFEVEQGTLYPLLRRLDEQGFLESDWTVDEGRPRKYYRLSPQGAGELAGLEEQWEQLVKVVNQLLRPKSGTKNPRKGGAPAAKERT
jgi:DNA-binding PadR family transcriptional regulator